MFVTGRTYRHISCLDVDIYVVKTTYIGKDYYKIKVMWLNRRNSDLNYALDKVRLMRKDVNKWSEV